VLAKKIVIEYQELLFKQNTPRGKLKPLWTVKTPQGIFTYGAVGDKKKVAAPDDRSIALHRREAPGSL